MEGPYIILPREHHENCITNHAKISMHWLGHLKFDMHGAWGQV
jgi:hypothetical protein